MLRKARLSDAADIADIYNYYVLNTTFSFEESPISPHDMRQRMSDILPLYPFLVDEHQGKIRGFCYAHRWKKRAAYRHTWEITIYMHPLICGCGHGKKLMQEFITQCKERGCRTLIACITGENERSRQFHQRIGFCQVSHFEKVGEKFGRELDVDDFELRLHPNATS